MKDKRHKIKKDNTTTKPIDQFICLYCDKDPKVWPHPLDSCDQRCWDRYYGLRDSY